MRENKQFGFTTRFDKNGLLSHRSRLEGVVLFVSKTKMLLSCAVTARLICVFVFAYADCWFSDAVAKSFCYMYVKCACCV